MSPLHCTKAEADPELFQKLSTFVSTTGQNWWLDRSTSLVLHFARFLSTFMGRQSGDDVLAVNTESGVNNNQQQAYQ